MTVSLAMPNGLRSEFGKRKNDFIYLFLIGNKSLTDAVFILATILSQKTSHCNVVWKVATMGLQSSSVPSPLKKQNLRDFERKTYVSDLTFCWDRLIVVTNQQIYSTEQTIIFDVQVDTIMHCSYIYFKTMNWLKESDVSSVTLDAVWDRRRQQCGRNSL